MRMPGVYTGMPIATHNLDGYGAPPIEWSRVREVLDSQLPQAPGTGGPDRHTSWLTTINPDGGPHVTALGIVKVDGTWYFTSGPHALTAEYNAPSAGPPPWYVYRLVPSTVYALATAEPHGATKFEVTVR
jgi:hypothetical protein